MRNSALGLVMLVVLGCTASYQVNNLSGAAAQVKLDPSKGVYISVPEDGSYESKKYGGSGQIVAGAVAVAFGKKAASIHVATKNQPLDSVLAAARQLGVGYVVVPAITAWEQRSTEWSGKPSRMTIRLEILEATSGKQLLASSIEGRSRIMSFTSTSPESLLKDPLAEYVNSIY